MEKGYAIWMGQSVILKIVTGDLRVPVRGQLVSEAGKTLRLRVDESWDVDIYKSMVAGVEQDTPVQVIA